ncbi:isochorismatase family protein [Halopseudomonas pachastrellae]|nr:isochorismatase family protein [Halopseudomonas pachastrellae]
MTGQTAGQGHLGLRSGRRPATAAGRPCGPKPRYSGFFNTAFDSLLRARGIRNLVFTGIATNVCVESTLRDGFFLEYFGVVLADATHQAGPDPDSSSRPRCTTSKPSLAGSAASMTSALP